MVERRDVEFGVDGGDRLRGWLFLPSKRAGPLPAISVAHGYAGVKEHGLERFARAFRIAVAFNRRHRPDLGIFVLDWLSDPGKVLPMESAKLPPFQAAPRLPPISKPVQL